MELYLSRTLMPDEFIVYVARLHGTVYQSGLTTLVLAAVLGGVGYYVVPNFFQGTPIAELARWLVALAFCVAAVIGASDLYFTYLRQKSTELVVTNQRLLIKYGTFGATIYQTLLDKITGVDIEQTASGRLEGYGTVAIMASASHIPPIDHVADPFRLQAQIMRRNEPLVLTPEMEVVEKPPAVKQETTPLLGLGSAKKGEGEGGKKN